MSIGAGLAFNNVQKTSKVDAAAGDAASGSWTKITSPSDINTKDDFLIGWEYEGTPRYTTGSVSSSALNCTTTISSAKVVRFETATDGYYIKHTSSTYINNASKTDISLGNKSSIWFIDSNLYIRNKSNSNRFLGAASNSESAKIKAYATGNEDSYPQAFVYKTAASGPAITSISLSTKTAGGPNYDADGESSFQVTFNTAINYTSTVGSNKVNISVAPNNNVTGQGNNKTAGDFTLTFTKSGTYKVSSSAVEDIGKYAEITVKIDNILTPGYELINNVGGLRAGSKYVIGTEQNDYVLGTKQNSNNRDAVSYTIENNFIPIDDVTSSIEVITLETTTGGWFLKGKDNKYLAITENENRLTSSNTGCKFVISFNGDVANIVPADYPSRVLQKNNSSALFACYTGSAKNVKLFKQVETEPYFSINTQQVYLGNRGTQTLVLTPHNKATDTVTWSSNNAIISVSPLNGLSTIITAAETGTGEAVVTATFASGNYDPINVAVEVIPLDTYVNVGVTTFTKVTSTPTGGWSGTYLLVDETANRLFDGSASPLGGGSYKEIPAPSGTIAATTDMIASSFNIKASAHGYTLKSNSNYYVGNTVSDDGIETSLKTQYEVSISDTGVISALLAGGTSGSKVLRSNSTYNIFRFYGNATTGHAVALYKANGEMRAITSTLTAWYDNAKAEGYLSCHASGTGSSIDWDKLYESAIEMLTVADLDTLENMTAKSAEDNGNYLEDFISDYDYLVAVKGYDDFLGREAAGSLSVTKVPQKSLLQNNNYLIVVIIIASVISVSTLCAFFLLRKYRKHN